MAREAPSTDAQKTSCFAFWYGEYGGWARAGCPGPGAPAGLRGAHGGPVVRHERPGQLPLLDGLREAVDEGLGGLREVPLEVSGEPGAVVEDAEQVGGDPRPLAVNTLRLPVIVGVPQPVHGRELEGADLDRRALLLGA